MKARLTEPRVGDYRARLATRFAPSQLHRQRAEQARLPLDGRQSLDLRFETIDAVPSPNGVNRVEHCNRLNL